MGLKTCLNTKQSSQHIQSFIKSLCIFASRKQINMFLMSWDSVVSTANCYRLDGLGIESHWR
jgi:hypothetical protein